MECDFRGCGRNHQGPQGPKRFFRFLIELESTGDRIGRVMRAVVPYYRPTASIGASFTRSWKTSGLA